MLVQCPHRMIGDRATPSFFTDRSDPYTDDPGSNLSPTLINVMCLMPSTFLLPPEARALQSQTTVLNSEFKIGVLDVQEQTEGGRNAERVKEMLREHAAIFQVAVVSKGQASNGTRRHVSPRLRTATCI